MLFRKSIFVVAFLCVVSKSMAQSPVEFNDILVSITDSLQKKGSTWGTKFQEVSDSKNFRELAPIRLNMQHFIDRKIAELQKTKMVGKGAKEFVQIMIHFLQSEKSLVNQAFVPLEKLNEKSTDEMVKAAIDKLSNDVKKEDEELKKVNAAQQDYAEKNNFSLEPDEDATE